MTDNTSSNYSFGQDLDPQVQAMLNQPLKDDAGIDPVDEVFLQIIVNKIENGQIKSFVPSSLINQEVYSQLDEKTQGKVDYDAFRMLGAIREIYGLWKLGHRDSYQIKNLVHKIRLVKEALEQIRGDIFII